MYSNELNVKVGDEVAVGGNYGYSIIKVEKVTPTGRIKCSDGRSYDKNGNQIGGSTWHSSYIKILTNEIREEILLKKYHNTLTIAFDDNRKNIKNLSKEQSKELIDLFNKYFPKKDT